LGKRIIIPEFRFNGKPWVVIPRQEKDWYPSLIDHATILVGIGMCEEWKYPQIEGKRGWRYSLQFYMDCMKIIEEYTLTDSGLIISPEIWNIEEIHNKCAQIYITQYDPFLKTSF